MNKLFLMTILLVMVFFIACNLDVDGRNESGMAIDKDNNIYIIGDTWKGNSGIIDNENILLIKFSNDGEKEWEKKLETESNDIGRFIITDKNNNFYIVGETDGKLDDNISIGKRDVFIAKFNSDGQKQWLKQWGTSEDEFIHSLSINEDGDIYAIGKTSGSFDNYLNAGKYDIFLTKFNNTGDIQWTKQWGTNENDNVSFIKIINNNNIYITGWIFDGSGGYTSSDKNDIFLIKINNENEEFIKQWTTLNMVIDVTINNNEEVYVISDTESLSDENSDIKKNNILLTKFNIKGEEQWKNNMGSSGSDGAYSLITRNRNIYITGKTRGSFAGSSNKGETDAFLAKFDDKGDKLWIKQWGTSEMDTGQSIVIDSNGNAFVSGETMGSFDGYENESISDVFLSKFDKDGNKLWTKL